MHQDKLKITYTTTDNQVSEIDDSVCDYKFEIELDPSDMSSHQLFGVFSKVLSAMGYGEFSIMKGACGLAFNDMRDMEMMNKLVEEYELAKIPEEADITRKREQMYKSVNYSSKENQGYEPG